MQTTLHAVAKRARTLAVASIAAAAMLTAGCASAAVTHIDPVGLMQPVSAEVFYVHAFGASPDQVKLDGGVLQKIKTVASGGSDGDAQTQAAVEAREQVANDIVRQLQARGLNAVRTDGPAPAGANALIVDGDFRKIDEGTGRRRLLIGLGAGKSELVADVRISYQSNGASNPVLLQRFTANADSGRIPGVAETAGIGAAASHAAISAAAGASVHGISEVKHDTVYADATRLGDNIATQVMAASTEEGWLAGKAAL